MARLAECRYIGDREVAALLSLMLRCSHPRVGMTIPKGGKIASGAVDFV